MVDERIPVNFVYEDILHKATIEKIILTFFKNKYKIDNYYYGRGFGWIKNNINSFNRASINTTYIVLVDLDKDKCPFLKIQDWLASPKGNNLLLRVAVNEVETWIVGDVRNFSKFLHLHENRLEKNVETIKDPKKYIFDLVRESGIRQLAGICPRGGARIGNDYNEKLKKFVESSWNPSLAMRNSRSLKRSIDRLKAFSPLYSDR